MKSYTILTPVYNDFNSLELIKRIYKYRGIVFKQLIYTFSITFVLLFVLEQLFVGGNIPFYERYLFQIMPFICIVLFYNVRTFKFIYFLFPLLSLVIGQYMIWRYL